MDARRQVLQGEAVWNLVGGAEKVLVAVGKKVEEYVPASKTKESILARIVGRSGNLRAPVLRNGRVVYVGYNEELYAAELLAGLR